MRPHAAALKALLDEPRLQIMPGCGDGMGAHLIEEAGFRTGFISGSSISAMRLAMPDMDLVSFGEMADAVETCIAAAPNVLWLADGDTGHGNALAVQKVIRTYARRGAAAVLIEDKIWPRPLGHGGAKLVIERDAAVLRCRAAVEACRDEGPQDILAASVQAIRAALGGLKGGAKPAMASPGELATAIRSDEYLAQDARWPDPR